MPKFNITNLALAIISALYFPQSFASIVNENIDYQTFRDFAENKGVFSAGSSNIPIKDKNGKVVYTINKPMVDFASADVQSVTTLVNHHNPQYVNGVKHNNYTDLRFGGFGNNPDYKRANYHVVDINNYNNTKFNGGDSVYNKDLHASRLHKLVTETVPADVIKDAFTGNQTYIYSYLNTNRFPVFFRMGSGSQEVYNPVTKKYQFKAYPYDYVIGGMTPNPNYNQGYKVQFSSNWDKYPFSSVIQSGDSGSGIYVFDTSVNKWVLYGSAQSGNRDLNAYIILDYRFLSKSYADDLVDKYETVGDKLSLIKTAVAGQYSLQDGENNNLFSGYNPNKSMQDDPINYRSDNDAKAAAGKNITIAGNDAVIDLKNNLNQGAGSITFAGNYTIKSDNNSTYTGAGIVIDKDKKVIWKINGIDGDDLHRIGAGELEIAAKGINPTGLRVGDGITYLNQQPDKNGKVQAAKFLHIASGRPTVILANEKQVDGSQIYFGFKGGRLDLNGNSIQADRIKSVDSGAKIVNNNANKTANLLLTGSKDDNISTVSWSVGKIYDKGALFFYKNGYFRYKKYSQIASYIPDPGNSNEQFEYIGNDLSQLKEDKLKANNYTFFAGNLGETDKTKVNGALNLTFNPALQEAVFALAGDNNLNGNFNIAAGKAIIQGRAREHAYDVLNNKDVVYDYDWIDSKSKFTQINVNSGATLELSRNATLNSDVNLAPQATFIVGYGENSSYCLRSDRFGSVSCSTDPISDQAKAELKPSKFTGKIKVVDSFKDNSTVNPTANNLKSDTAKVVFNLAYNHAIEGIPADVVVNEKAVWSIDKDTSVRNLQQNGGSIKLSAQHGSYHNLTVNNQLSGNGKFYFNTNTAANIGDKLTFKQKVLGKYDFIVNDIGDKANKNAKLYLTNKLAENSDLQVNLVGSDNKDYLDVGAYRYKLQQDSQGINLFNNLLIKQEAEEKAKQAAAEAKAKQEAEEKAKQAAAEAKAKQEAEEKAKQAAAEAKAKREAEEKVKQAAAEAKAKQEAEEKAKQEAAEDKAKREAEEKAKQAQQKDWVSNVANVGLSQMALRFEQLRSLTDALERRLMLKDEQNTGLYVLALHDKNSFSSDNYRDFSGEQNGGILGYDVAFTSRLIAGVNFMAMQGNYDLDEAFLDKIKTLTIGFYAKYKLDNNFYTGISFGGGNQYSEIKHNGIRVKIRQRSLYQQAFIGTKFDFANNFSTNAQLGITNYWLDGRHYTFKGVSIGYGKHNTQKYAFDVNLTKRFYFAGNSLDLYTTLGLARYANYKLDMMVDNNKLILEYPKQQITAEFGLNLNFGAWQLTTSFEHQKANNRSINKTALGVNYHF